jgi:hypothetical protein
VKEERRYLKEYVSKGGPPYKNGDYFAALYMKTPVSDEVYSHSSIHNSLSSGEGNDASLAC